MAVIQNYNQLAKYLKNKYQSTNIVTLPHFGSLWRSLAAHEMTMTLKSFCARGLVRVFIGNLVLVLGVNGEYFDKSLLHMFIKMMIEYFDVLCPRAKLGKPCQFEDT